MSIQISGKKVITRTEQDLKVFLENKKSELAIIDKRIASLKTKQEEILAELEALIPKTK